MGGDIIRSCFNLLYPHPHPYLLSGGTPANMTSDMNVLNMLSGWSSLVIWPCILCSLLILNSWTDMLGVASRLLAPRSATLAAHPRTLIIWGRRLFCSPFLLQLEEGYFWTTTWVLRIESGEGERDFRCSEEELTLAALVHLSRNNAACFPCEALAR